MKDTKILTPTPINRILHNELLNEILKNLLINKPVKLLRFIAKTGRQASSVPWIYVENEITGDRMATFVSFKDLLAAFWSWLDTAQVLFLAWWQRIAISKVIWQFVSVGEMVHTQGYGWCEVVEKDFTEGKGIPRFWLDTGDKLTTIMPVEAQLF